MAAGCRNPNAVNYNSSATSENYSCIYLKSHSGVCYEFDDVQPNAVTDQSFTLSYSLAGQSWVFFHDYFPDMYVHNRKSLYSIKGNTVYKHHEGAPGNYYETTPYSFFIDVIFRDGEGTTLLLETINWITDYSTDNGKDAQFSTLSHISAWTGQQHTGRIALSQIFNELEYTNIRRTKSQWSMKEFRDVLSDNPGGQFISTLFNNFAIITGQIEQYPVWYEQGPIQDKWICVRFEFDNGDNAKVILQDTNITAQPSNR